jgi:hypothetical protein
MMQVELKYFKPFLKKFLLFLSGLILILHTLFPHFHSKINHSDCIQVYSEINFEEDSNLLLDFITQNLGENHLEVFFASNFDTFFILAETFTLNLIKKYFFIPKKNVFHPKVIFLAENYHLSNSHRGPPSFIF